MLIGIDANAIIHRAYHAFPPSLSTADGVQVNAVFGFTSMLLSVLEEFDPKYIVCAFDTPKPTFRHAKFADYKAHRKPTDKSLIAQFPLVEEVLQAFNIPILKVPGFEADDILGTVSAWVESGRWSEMGLEMSIVTGDKDILQLVSDKVTVYLPIKGFKNLTKMTPSSVLDNYGYRPDQVIDFKAFVGDPSDNIPGIKGVGEKSVIKLLQEFDSFEGIYKNIDQIKGRLHKLLEEGLEQAAFSRDLATISKEAPVSVDLESCLMREFDVQKLIDIFKRFEFRSLINKIPKSIGESRGDPLSGQLNMLGSDNNTSGIQETDLSSSLEKVKDLKSFLSKLNGPIDKVFGCYLKNEELALEDEVFLVRVVVGDMSVDFELEINQENMSYFKDLMLRETYFYNWEDLVSRSWGSVDSSSYMKSLSQKVFDIKIASHLLSSGLRDYSFRALCFEKLSIILPEKFSPNEYAKILSCMDELSSDLKKIFNGMEESLSEGASSALAPFLTGHSHKELFDVSMDIDCHVACILADMENRGIMVDRTYLGKFKTEISEKVEELKSEVFKYVGHEFNLNSPKQLSSVLYNELNLISRGRRSLSTRESVLKELEAAHPAIKYILEYREVSKLLNTYLKPFDEITKKSLESEGLPLIHTDFKMLGASSGRFASTEPNMQNIPIRGELAMKVREIFIPREGFVFVGSDYSQIEFRIIAHLSKDEKLIKDFKDGRDLHASTAARILGLDVAEVTKDQRALGKVINFGILYGQSTYGLAKMLKIENALAEKYINDYFETYKGVAEYIKRESNNAMQRGWVETILGRRRQISGLNSQSRGVKSAAIREAVNMPIQGGAADVMKIAMIKLDEQINKEYKNAAFILLQIHDEFIFEVRADLVERFSKDVEDIMDSALKLEVPLDVSVSSGMNMSELK